VRDPLSRLCDRKLGRGLEPIGFTALAIQIPLLIGVLAFLSPVSLPYYQPTGVWTLIGVASFVLCGVSFVVKSTLRSVIVSGRAGFSPHAS
jgi:hypothetical protein